MPKAKVRSRGAQCERSTLDMRSALPSRWAGPGRSCPAHSRNERSTCILDRGEPTTRSSRNGEERGTASVRTRWTVLRRRLNLALLADMSCNVRVTLNHGPARPERGRRLPRRPATCAEPTQAHSAYRVRACSCAHSIMERRTKPARAQRSQKDTPRASSRSQRASSSRSRTADV